jgi:ABC-type transport system involved in cytochrome bd biosynthesis fused ATPase/permease subunit
MAPVLSIAEVRDIVVIVYGVIGIVFFFFAVIVLVVLGFTVKGLLRSVSEILDESVKPTMESIKNAADTVRGTAEFVGKTAVSPIVKTYGAFAGVRKGLGVLSGLSRRKSK